MELNWRGILKWAAILVVGLVVSWVVYTFAASEQTQMLRVQAKFIKALEKKQWSTVDAMISKDYEDDWGQGQEVVKGAMREVLGGFIFLSLEQQIATSRVVTGLGYVKTRIKVEGTGGGISGMVVSAANAIKTPWVFHWHKRGRWPWSWELVQIHNDEVDFGLRHQAR